MSLKLKVLSFKNQPINEISTVSISADGGSIGRSNDNTLVLPDAEKFVSRHHATISVENGRYYLSDTSLSGVYFNGQQTPLNNASAPLENGMLLKIGEYEIAVAIEDDLAVDDFPFVSTPKALGPDVLAQPDGPWLEWEEPNTNSLMTDNLMTDSFPAHEELVQAKSDPRPVAFASGLESIHSPLSDSYTAPGIIGPAMNAGIPENISFDDFFSASDEVPETDTKSIQAVNKAAVDDAFENFFDAAISAGVGDLVQSGVNGEIFAAHQETGNAQKWADGAQPLPAGAAPLFSAVDEPALVRPEMDTHHEEIKPDTAAVITSADESQGIAPAFAVEPPPPVGAGKSALLHPKAKSVRPETAIGTAQPAIINPIQQADVADGALFKAFLQGVAVQCDGIRPGQQAETLHRVGQMFRKLVDGTVAVLRSRAEFKSLCRVSMTVIRATDNNPLKFTVSTDDVLQQLIENKTDGFLASTEAIEEAFNDIMNHQLAMQAGIQASLNDLLKALDPKVIEKQFEQGIVLQKKSKCWDKYEETYRDTVEDAVDSFYGEEFVKAYEKQMGLLTNSRRR